jgi:hypothetical protein
VSPSGATHRRRRRGPAATALLATLLALLFHASVLGLLLLLNFVSVKWPGGDRVRPKPQAVTLRNIDPRAWAKNRVPAREQERPEPQRRAEAAKKPQPKDEKNPKGQVVDVALATSGSPDARFPRRRTTGRQGSKAKGPDAFYRNAMPKQTATEARRPPARTAPRRSSSGQRRMARTSARPGRAADSDRCLTPTLKQRDQIALGQEQGPGRASRTRGRAPRCRGTPTGSASIPAVRARRGTRAAPEKPGSPPSRS